MRVTVAGLNRLLAARRYCFQRGVLGKNPDGTRDLDFAAGRNEDFRQAFRTLNRLYCELKRQLHIRRGRLEPRTLAA